MKSIKKFKATVLFLLGLSSVLAVAVLPTSCGGRTPERVQMMVGERVVATPLPVTFSLVEGIPQAPARKILITLSTPGRDLVPAPGAVVHFYSSTDTSVEPIYSLALEDLPYMHLRTGCSSSDVALLDNDFQSDFLICDGSFPISDVRFMQYVDSKGKKKSATSFVYHTHDNDLLAAGVTFD